MQRLSEIQEIFESRPTSTHNLPVRTTGQCVLHSCLHLS